MRFRRSTAALVASVLVAPVVGFAEAREPVVPVSLPALAQDRSVEPVVLEGSRFPGWSAGPELSAREPVNTSFNSDCEDVDGRNHNCSQASRIGNPVEGVAVDRLLGYRWDEEANRFVQIPFQVDERFTRYISNLASNCNEAGPLCVGFGTYSGADPQLSYVFDREGYRFTEHAPHEECRAIMKPGDGPEQDPTRGLDDNDELAFLYRDTGAQAPADAPLPKGVEEMRAVGIIDPTAPLAGIRYAYVALAKETGGATAAYTADNGYMRYVRDATADLYHGTSSNYGNAPRGPYCNEEGVVIGNGPRRPRDTGWVLSPRYAVQYAGRWVVRGFRVADGDRDEPLAGPSEYGPPLVDQWKARAYQQKPGDTTPCCGFQTEQDDWGNSSVLLGEKAGPVRVIRAAWGSNSGTNTVRQEIFYPDVIVQQNFLRVHPIPPLGGIFSYWDHTAGVVTKYYNPQRPDGVDVDGKNDEVFGTLYANPGDGEVRNQDDTPVVGPLDVKAPFGFGCFQYCAELDVTDPTLNAATLLTWEQVAGEFGSMVFTTSVEDLTPGAAQGLLALPYYRDDACFDDGTGTDPGPHLRPKQVDVPERPCWDADADERPTGDPAHDVKWRQGLIGGHGVQVIFVPETDNAFTTVPATELQARTRIVMLPGDQGNVGDRYGLAEELPLQTLVAPVLTSREADDRQPSAVSFRAVQQGKSETVIVNSSLTEAETGDGLEGRELRILVDGELRATVRSGEDGSAHVKITETEPEGKMFRVEFSGDEAYAPAAAEGRFGRNGAKG